MADPNGPTEEDRAYEDALIQAIKDANAADDEEPLKLNAGVSSEVDDLTLELTGAIEEDRREQKEAEQEEEREFNSVFQREIDNGTLELEELQSENLFNAEILLEDQGMSREEIRERLADMINAQSVLGPDLVAETTIGAYEAEGTPRDNINYQVIRVLNRGLARVEMPS